MVIYIFIYKSDINCIVFLVAGIRIAGGSTDFVNKVLENMRGGMPNGGLEDLRKS